MVSCHLRMRSRLAKIWLTVKPCTTDTAIWELLVACLSFVVMARGYTQLGIAST